MNSRGSAYVYSMIMCLSLMLVLTMSANTTVYEAQISAASRNYANVSALAYAGAERAVLAINRQMAADRAQIAERAAASAAVPADYSAQFAREAVQWANDRFAGSQLVFTLCVPPDDVYTVTVQITPESAGRFTLTSRAEKDGLPTGEVVTAVIVYKGDADIRQYADGLIVITGNIGWEIEKLALMR